MEKLTLNEFKQYINADYPVHFFESVDSTNTVAARLAGDSAPHGTTVIALHQSRGKGRLGRSFASPGDSGIYMSIILEPASSNPVFMTTAAAVAVCRAMEKVCGADPEIKWVNDVYLNGKKVCGILAEAVADHKTGKISRIVLGIGVNCDSEAIPEELADIAGAVEGHYSINRLAAEILNQMMALADNLDDSAIIEYYKQHSMVLGKAITVYKSGFAPGAAGKTARALDIDQAGSLIVLYEDGTEDTLSTGEISIRL